MACPYQLRPKKNGTVVLPRQVTEPLVPPFRRNFPGNSLPYVIDKTAFIKRSRYRTARFNSAQSVARTAITTALFRARPRMRCYTRLTRHALLASHRTGLVVREHFAASARSVLHFREKGFSSLNFGLNSLAAVSWLAGARWETLYWWGFQGLYYFAATCHLAFRHF
jgi:hypothetical protein